MGVLPKSLSHAGPHSGSVAEFVPSMGALSLYTTVYGETVEEVLLGKKSIGRNRWRGFVCIFANQLRDQT